MAYTRLCKKNHSQLRHNSEGCGGWHSTADPVYPGYKATSSGRLSRERKSRGRSEIITDAKRTLITLGPTRATVCNTVFIDR
jgi:hypothetical protein